MNPDFLAPGSQEPGRIRKYRPTGRTTYTNRDVEGLTKEIITATNETAGISRDRR
jgi:hypothetical protein